MMTLGYWLRWVKMIEIWRCENEFVERVVDILDLDAEPRRGGASIVTLACKPPCSRSVVTSMMPGRRRNALLHPVHPGHEFLGVGIDHGELGTSERLAGRDIGQLPRRPHVGRARR